MNHSTHATPRGPRPGALRLGAVLVAAASLAACVPEVRDLELDVSFDGLGCADARLDQVRITFETGGLSGISVPCVGRGRVSVIAEAIPPGPYRILVEGLDRGFPAYASRFDVTVRRDADLTYYRLDLAPALEVVTRFTFAGWDQRDGMTCEQAGVDRVDLYFGGIAFRDVPCRSNGVDAAELLGLEAGVYDVRIDGFDSGRRLLYSSEFRNVRLFSGSNVLTLNALALEDGGMELSWRFAGDSSCALSGVVTVEFVLLGPDGYRVLVDNPAVVACHDGPVRITGLEPGLYTLQYADARDSGGVRRFRRTSVPLYVPAGNLAGFSVNLSRT